MIRSVPLKSATMERGVAFGGTVTVIVTEALPPDGTVMWRVEKTAVAAILPAIAPAGFITRLPFWTTTSCARTSNDIGREVPLRMVSVCDALSPVLPRNVTLAGESDTAPSPAKAAGAMARKRMVMMVLSDSRWRTADSRRRTIRARDPWSAVRCLLSAVWFIGSPLQIESSWRTLLDPRSPALRSPADGW
jgi:hypothetical protein